MLINMQFFSWPYGGTVCNGFPMQFILHAPNSGLHTELVIFSTTLFAFTRSCSVLHKRNLAGKLDAKLQMSTGGGGSGRESWFVRQRDQVSVGAMLSRKGNCWHKHISLCSTHLHAANILLSQSPTHTNGKHPFPFLHTCTKSLWEMTHPAS